MSGLSTHVLDTSLGRPAPLIEVELQFRESRDRPWRAVGGGVTNQDGRIGDLLENTPLDSGEYRLIFDLENYLEESAFFPTATLHFRVEDKTQHFHVPLLLSPFGYTTYRGS